MVSNLDIIKTTFYRFAKNEIDYRNADEINANDVLEDIFQTALCIVTRGTHGKGDFLELQKGIGRISRFIFSESYHIEKAIVHASKAAYLSILIQLNAKTIAKFENPLQIKDWQIDGPLNIKMNKLKKSNPEAFFYWYKIYELKT